MLKALELYGFKSFCDKTRFEFPAGITVVVGPNGSGKSNIVDAIKWVLGEQSAKSLRGKEMADVIFKGSGGAKRRPANLAEATIVFDNSDGVIDYAAPEVHVTRRVYRSGEGEYLINGQACRLRDIKDLFRGTGVGADAYSLIEQGKVDSLLQASPKDRRAIFEEAAGISRFKAKKVEAQRRLDRVEQNLLRLSDIVDEVDNRLRRLKAQASKARRFKDYSDRLQDLRTQVGRVDWQKLTAELTEFTATLTELRTQLESLAAECDSEQSRAAALDQNLLEVEHTLRSLEAEASSNREALAGNQSRIAHERSALVDLDEQLALQRSQMLGLSGRAGNLKSQLQQASDRLEQAAATHAQQAAELEMRRTELTSAVEQLQTAKAQAESKRQEYVTNVRSAADLGNQITAGKSRLEASQFREAKARLRIEELAARVAESVAECEQLAQRYTAATRQLETSERQRKSKQTELDQQKSAWAKTRENLVKLNERRVATAERRTLLEEIERRMEGIASGVKEVLAAARSDHDGPFAGVRGMVADLINVTDRDKAEMLEIALGEQAQDLVVAGSQLFDALERGTAKFTGRVGFMRLHSTAPPRLGPPADLRGQLGVIGRAEDFVTTAPEYQHLVQWLLNDTWFVETLTDAMQYNRSVSVPLKFVTRDGQLIDRDGRVVAGKAKSAIGLLSRRAELRELNVDLSGLEQEIERGEQASRTLQATMEKNQSNADELAARNAQLKELAAESRLRLEAAEHRKDELTSQLTAAEAEQQSAASDNTKLAAQLAGHQQRLVALEEIVHALDTTLTDSRSDLQQLEQKANDCQKATTHWEVSVAKAEQRLEALRSQRDQLLRDQHERQQALEEAARQARRGHARRVATEIRILSATSEAAEQFLLNEQLESQRAEVSASSEQLRVEKKTAHRNWTAIQDQLRHVEQQQHSCELTAEKVKQQRSALEERLQDDYGITTDVLGQQLTSEEQAEREQVDGEINDLRNKITNLGSVNMDALDELTELESRHDSLGEQYRDLVEAKDKLERIIHKINADSRRLFVETLEAIRSNFKVLFRKVFGGGNADIVLEQDVDILECGIDIIATPPGKQSLGLSLLSGGERALTAVALLMAIFEYRPSPFCVLDEVDGPLDEANIGRFVGVLQEFLEWTKFVVVTHSKKTMTAANTLYGVTMQESGISKQVSVRFEDVNERGEISAAAVARSDRTNDDRSGAA